MPHVPHAIWWDFKCPIWTDETAVEALCHCKLSYNMRASDHQHYRDDDAETLKKKKRKPRKKATWRHLHCGAIQLGEKVNRKVKKKNSASSIYVSVKTNCLPYGKLLHHKKEAETGAKGSGGVERGGVPYSNQAKWHAEELMTNQAFYRNKTGNADIGKDITYGRVASHTCQRGCQGRSKAGRAQHNNGQMHATCVTWGKAFMQSTHTAAASVSAPISCSLSVSRCDVVAPFVVCLGFACCLCPVVEFEKGCIELWGGE